MEYMKEQFRTWDRETSLTFISMIVAAYAFVVMEKPLVGIAMGIAMHAIQVAAYEFVAPRFGWKPLEITIAFNRHVAPHLARVISRFQRA